jgi:hypothetical protein
MAEMALIFSGFSKYGMVEADLPKWAVSAD